MCSLILIKDSKGEQTLLNLNSVAYARPYESDYANGEVSGTHVYFNSAKDEGKPVLFNVPFEEFMNMVGLKEKTSNQKFV